MDSDAIDPREETIVRRLARFQSGLANNVGDDASNDSLDSAAQRDLASCQRLLTLLQEANPSIQDFDDAQSTGPPEETPARIGKFELLSQCGQGGFGVVFRARDTILHREVALKVPHWKVVSSPASQERFLAEARIAAALNHPNLVSILEADRIGPLCYIAYAYCKGPSLSQWLGAHPAPVAPRSAAMLVERIARALSLAHAASICHRDIKPSNILLDIQAGPNGQSAYPKALDDYVPKLTDFGLAKLLDSPNPLSASGQLLGTVRYMSPEQAGGKSSDVGPRSDVYSLGVVLYELLAGRTPFTDANELQTLLKTISEDVPPLDLERRFAPLMTICMKCLEKEPARRYPSCLELADDLRRFLDGLPIQAKKPGWVSRAWKAAKRHPMVSSAAVLASFGLLIGGIEGLRLWSDRQAERSMKESMALLAEKEQAIARTQYAHRIRLAHESSEKGDVKDAVARLRQLTPRENEADLRGFLWRHLWKRCWVEGNVIGEQGSPAYCTHLDPSGRWLATGGEDGSVCLWDVQERKLHWRRAEHAGDVNAVLFSNAGGDVYSAGADGTVRSYKTTNGEGKTLSELDGSSIEAMACFPDGKRLAVATSAGEIHVWDLERDQWSAKWIGHRSEINELFMDPSGQFLASASSDGTARLWDTATGQDVRIFRGHEGSVTGLAILDDGAKLVTTGVDGTLRIWSIKDGSLLESKRPHAERIDALAACDGRDLLATSSKDGTIKLWNAQSLESVSAIHTRSRTWSLTFDPKTATLYSARQDGRVFSVTPEDFRAKLSWPSGRPHILCSSPKGDSFAYGESATTVCVRRTRAQIVEIAILISDSQIDDIAFCATGEHLATSNEAVKAVLYWDSASGEKSGMYQSRAGVVTGMMPHPRPGTFLIELMNPNGVATVNHSSNDEVESFGPYDTLVNAAVSTFDESIAVWREGKQYGGELEVFKSSGETRALTTDGWSYQIHLSPDGPWVAAHLPPRSLMLWNYDSKTEPLTVTCSSSITTLAFSPRESLLAVGCEDGDIHFYSVLDGEHVATIGSGPGPVRSLVFSPDGDWMSAGHNEHAGAKVRDSGIVTHWYTHNAPLQ